MRHLCICAFLLIGLSAPFAGQTDNWKTYRNQNGNFSVLLPVDPTETTSGEGDQTSHTIQAIYGGVGYTVVYVFQQAEQPVDEPTFKVYRDSFMKGLSQCEVVREEPASHALSGHIGHWLRMNCNVGTKKMSFIGNLYWGKHYAYAVLVMFGSAPSDPPAAGTFTNSFAVLDANK